MKAYDTWLNRIPEEYAENLLENSTGPYPLSPEHDRHSLAMVKHYRSLVPLSQEARKPIFKLTTADGALGSHAVAARNAYIDFQDLAKAVLRNIPELNRAPSPTP